MRPRSFEKHLNILVRLARYDPVCPFSTVCPSTSVELSSGYDANGRALSYAHVEFRTQEAAEAAFEASSKKEIYVFDRHLRVEYAKYPQGTTQGDGEITALFYKDFRRGGEKGVREVFKDFESRIVGINCRELL